jgi:hypothetical protein
VGAAAFAAPLHAAEVLGGPAFYWQTEFGGQVAGKRRLGLAVQTQDASLRNGGAMSLVGLELVGQRAVMSLAGVPLQGRQYGLGQTDGEAAPVEAVAEQPWYMQHWAWWTAGGVAAAGAYVATTGDDDEAPPAGSDDEGGGEFCAPDGVPIPGCIPDPTTAAPPDVDAFTGGAALSGWDSRAAVQWLDAGTGQMGDLVSR